MKSKHERLDGVVSVGASITNQSDGFGSIVIIFSFQLIANHIKLLSIFAHMTSTSSSGFCLMWFFSLTSSMIRSLLGLDVEYFVAPWTDDLIDTIQSASLAISHLHFKIKSSDIKLCKRLRKILRQSNRRVSARSKRNSIETFFSFINFS